MQKIKIADITLRENNNSTGTGYSFKEKIEIAKKLDKLNVDIIETFKIDNSKTDILFLHTITPLLQNSIISCPVQYSEEAIEITANAIKDAKAKRLHLMIPTSSVQMEYICGKKPNAVLEMIETLTKKCASVCDDVEFSALDATRSEKEFLYQAIKAAIANGAKTITVCDSAGEMLPEEFNGFVNDLYENVPELKDVELGVECSDNLNMGAACMISTMTAGVTSIKTTVDGNNLPSIETAAKIIKSRGDSIGVYSEINYTELEHTIAKLVNMTDSKKSTLVTEAASATTSDIVLSKADDIKTVSAVITKLGYDLSDEDISNVYAEFAKLAEKKQISAKELDAIIANTALQVSPTYKLKNYVINSGNIMAATANIVLEKNGEDMQAVCIGDGPIDAAFVTIEKIVGRHFELDDFQIQSVTEGREAFGSAVVKLRSNGKLYSGKGISSDIIGASISAYINALNKICFEEA